MEIVHIEGDDKGKIFLYALSTCQWCRRTKELLESLGIMFDYLYVDLLPDDELQKVLKKVIQFNPRGSFPTLLINDTVIVGFHEDQIREALAL